MKLYDYFRSSASYRVRIALNLKGLTAEIIPVHLLKEGGEQFSEHYKKVNPQALVPSLEDDGNIFTQSLAIIQYLDERYPTPALLPKNELTKAHANAFALAIAADIHPLNNRRVLLYLATVFGVSPEQEKKWYQHWILLGFSALEQQLQQYNFGQPFCFGDTPSIADICLVPQMYNARRFSCDLSLFPNLVRIDKHCQNLRAFQLAEPEAITA